MLLVCFCLFYCGVFVSDFVCLFILFLVGFFGFGFFIVFVCVPFVGNFVRFVWGGVYLCIHAFIYLSLYLYLNYFHILVFVYTSSHSSTHPSIHPSIRPSICLCMSTLYLSQLFYVAFVSTIHQVHSSYYASNALARRRCCLSST